MKVLIKNGHYSCSEKIKTKTIGFLPEPVPLEAFKLNITNIKSKKILENTTDLLLMVFN